MAKKRRHNKKKHVFRPEFFEALPGILPMPGQLPRVETTSQDHMPVNTAPAEEWWREPVEVGRATAEDVGRYIRAGLGYIFSPLAIKLYLALAILGVGAGAVGVFMLASSTYAAYASDIGTPAAILSKKNTGTTILDRNGKVLYQVYGATNKVPVDFEQTPKPLINATLAAEDSEFFQHSGISWRGTARALVEDVTHRSTVQGGSTLTQQLVKNTLLTPDRTVIRKAQEIILATNLEHRYSKQQIMEMYLNGVYYGQGSYGVGTAAKTYFGKDVSQLTLGEDAMLAGLPLGPSRFDPTADPSIAQRRRDFVLDRMHSLGYIDDAQLANAKAEPIHASPQQIQIKAPHFVFYVLEQLRQKYGSDKVEHGGLTVYTTLDLNKQKIGEDVVNKQISRLGSLHVTNGALVSTDPATGEILAMVGSYNYNDPNFGSVNVTTSDRQPGSSIKPLVYLDAFTKGYTPATVVDDKPLNLPDGNGGLYQPKDYDLKYRGRVTVRRALSNSLNIPAVNTLRFVGLLDAINYAHSLGITTLTDPSQLGLSMVLGGGEVKMIDMAEAYGVFANGGKRVDLVSIQKVLDRNGKDITIQNAKKPPVQVADPRYVYMLTSILSDNKSRAEEFGTNSPLQLSRPSAAKTGTTTDWRDNWTIGYTPDVVTVAWAGNNDNTPMVGINGITGAAPIWHDYMEAILSGTPVRNFTVPTGMTMQKVCDADGGLANPWDASTHDEYFLTEAVPKNHCASTMPAPTPPPTDQPPQPDNKPAQNNPFQPVTTPNQPTPEQPGTPTKKPH